MEHLSLENLARLVDHEAVPGARPHLEDCAACAAELRALREQTEGLRALPDLLPPVGHWEALEARLVSEGLVEGRSSLFRVPRLPLTPGWVQAAAALILFLGGLGMGVALQAPAGIGPGGASDDGAFRLAAASTVDEAADDVRRAERAYMDALLRFQQLREATGGDVTGEDPASRFAALDALVATSQAAVRQAPADPFINGILISALAERQAALRRISTDDDNWY